MKERDIFIAAVQKANAAERQAYLDVVCGADAVLRQQVESLLKACDQVGGFLEGSATGRASTIDEPMREQPGTVIGPYKLLQQIGEGGMGTVFVAEQSQPLQRRVALKLIKSGMESGQVIARFEAERQALALMDHPNIAKVLDAGTTSGESGRGSAGRPYFVMELVKGVPLTKYCDRECLSLQERLALFVPVCQAIQHAHQKGIIHRDLKPSNVLIGLYDGTPVPKVIDFGVAKATGQKLSEHTVFTGLGTMIGTLEYMAPEQAELNNLDIDTRADIYSLGVLLYELVTGSPPFTGKQLRSVAFDEMLRLIGEQEPPRPSTRLSSSDELPAIAARRKLEPRRLARLVRGDLDWIVMKCLEKDRGRRYESANGLAQDLLHFLADEPVKAARPSRFYRFRKIARRHKAVVRATILVAVLAVTAGTALLWQEQAKTRTAFAALRFTSYLQSIALADREWDANNLERAEQHLAACPEDLRGWEWDYLKRLRLGSTPPLRGHQGPVGTVAFSPNGRLLVSGGMDGTIKVWDVATWKEMRSFQGNNEETRSLAFSPDGRRCAGGFGDGQVICWDTKTWQAVRTFHEHTAGVSGLAFSPDGRYLAAAGWDHLLTVWDAGTGALLDQRKEEEWMMQSVVFSPDSRRLVYTSEQLIRILDVTTWKEVRTLTRDGSLLSSALSGEGRYVAAGAGTLGSGEPGVVNLWDAQSGEALRSFRGHTRAVLSVAFSPDGRRLATASDDLTVKLWDVASGRETLTLRTDGEPPVCLAFSPDGRYLACATNGHSVRVWNATPLRDDEPGQELQTLAGHSSGVFAAVFSPDGRLLASTSGDGTAILWNTTTWREIYRLPGKHKGGSCVAFSRDSRRLACACDSGVQIWDVRTGRAEVKPLVPKSDGDILGVAFSPDGRYLATCGMQRTVLWDAATGQEWLVLGPYDAVNTCVRFSPDGSRVAAADFNGTIWLWDVTSRPDKVAWFALLSGPDLLPGLSNAWTALTKRNVFVFRAHAGRAWGVAFSPDGRWLASGGLDNRVVIWDAQSGKPYRTLVDPTGGVLSVTFSPDGRHLAWGSTDSTVKIAALGTGQVMATLRGHTNWVAGVGFSSEGQYLASAGMDGTVKIWDTRIQPLAPDR